MTSCVRKLLALRPQEGQWISRVSSDSIFSAVSLNSSSQCGHRSRMKPSSSHGILISKCVSSKRPPLTRCIRFAFYFAHWKNLQLRGAFLRSAPMRMHGVNRGATAAQAICSPSEQFRRLCLRLMLLRHMLSMRYAIPLSIVIIAAVETCVLSCELSWYWLIVNDGRNEWQKSGGSNFRKQMVQPSNRRISAGKAVTWNPARLGGLERLPTKVPLRLSTVTGSSKGALQSSEVQDLASLTNNTCRAATALALTSPASRSGVDVMAGGAILPYARWVLLARWMCHQTYMRVRKAPISP